MTSSFSKLANAIRIDEESRLAHIVALALHGEVREALCALEVIPRESLSLAETQYVDDFKDRFQRHQGHVVLSKDKFVASVQQAYIEYWRSVLLKATADDTAEAHLVNRLKVILGREVSSAVEFACLEPTLRRQLAASGYHALLGVTRPFRELMLWRRETVKDYSVSLVEKNQNVTVVFLEEFESLGWAAYATLDIRYTLGWAAKDRIYCVREAYDLNDEKFQISYLAHEAQHFADYETFPKLGQAELEYRAKLVELAKAKKTIYRLVQKFIQGSNRNHRNPHGLADFWIIRNLAQEMYPLSE